MKTINFGKMAVLFFVVLLLCQLVTFSDDEQLTRSECKVALFKCEVMAMLSGGFFPLTASMCLGGYAFCLEFLI